MSGYTEVLYVIFAMTIVSTMALNANRFIQVRFQFTFLMDSQALEPMAKQAEPNLMISMILMDFLRLLVSLA